MALVKCHECGSEVSTEAAACPKCGAKPKVAGLKATLTKKGGPKELLIGLIVVVGMIYWAAHSPDDDTPPASTQEQVAAQEAAKDAQCKQDLQCWGDKNIVAASVYCKPSIEKLAQYSVRWTDGMLETSMSRFRWLDKTKGTLTYIGDKAEFQNGFGAYQAMVYECDFDPATNTVFDARARPGRL